MATLTQRGKAVARGIATMWLTTAATGAHAAERLSAEEVLWCHEEEVRIEAVQDVLDDGSRADVEWFNARIDTFNERCAQRSHLVRDGEAARRSVDERQGRLKAEGRAALAAERRQRLERQAHVSVDGAIIRARPDEHGEAVEHPQRWQTVEATGEQEGGWRRIAWRAPDLDQTLRYGWIWGGFVAAGSGREGRGEACRRVAGAAATHNEEIGRGQSHGEGFLTIENVHAQDAYVKVRGTNGETIRNVYVGAGDRTRIEGIPRGSLTVAFATGTEFSRGCDSFGYVEHAARFTRRLDHHEATAGWTLTLHPSPDGNARTARLTPEAFAAL